MKKKFSKILGVGLAVSLVLSLMLMALPVGAHDSVAVTVTDSQAPTDDKAGFADPPLDVDIRVQVGNPMGDLDYDFDWQYKQNENDVYDALSTYPLLFPGNILDRDVYNEDNDITESWTLGIPGWYELTVNVYDDADAGWFGPTMEQIRVLGIIPEDIAYDVKGGQQHIAVKGMLRAADNYSIQWSLVAGVDLTPDDIIVKIPIDAMGMPPIPNTVDPSNPATYRKVGWTEEYNGYTGQEWVEGFASIHIEAMKRGDIHIYATVSGDPLGNPNGEWEDIVLHTEKKWGELDHSVLDLDADEDGIQGPTIYHTVAPLNMDDIYETIEDTIYATFLEVVGPRTVGDAIVHWWLFDDTEDNQALIDELMDHLASQEGWVDPYWQAAGKYNTEWIGDWMAALGYAGPADREPFDAIDFLAKDIADGGLGLHADPVIFSWDESGAAPFPDLWYYQNETPDSWPNEDRGVVQATLVVDASELEECIVEEVMIVVLVTYPGSGNPKDDPFNGENIVIIEKGKKQFHKTKIAQVKTTQLRWAGEKIVLEKYWGTDYYYWDPMYGDMGNLVMFALEEGSIGVLIPLGPYDLMSSDSRTVFTSVGEDGVARVMFKTEQQGQVDVEAVLYGDYFPIGASFDEVNTVILDGGWWVLLNTGFVVYYLFIEEVTPREPAPQPVDPDEAAVFAVDVKGSFWTTSLPGTTREARTVTFETDVGTMEYELPYGRYVLPDDWPLMAGPNWRLLRPWMDIMADPGNVSSTYELGPFDGGVNSPSGVAALPSIGPFSSLQPWSINNMWITDGLVVPADGATDMDPFLPDVYGSWNTRNTVIPDDWVSASDAPMPPAEIHFIITDYSAPPMVVPSLSAAFKNTLLDRPFFASEIPANRLIPPMKGTVEGYWWDSWEFGGVQPPENAFQGEGPYWFHWDLGQTPLDRTILEAYSDNLGTAAVYINALDGAGYVTIEAKADYPYLPAKFPPVVSDEVTQIWGPIILNPHFSADETLVEVGDTVTFTNLTDGGTLPYTDADWDWGDGTTHGITAVNNGETIPHVYNTPGVWSVKLTMTDSTPTTRYEVKPNYITVVPGPVVDDILDYYRGLEGDLTDVSDTELLQAAYDWANHVIPSGFTTWLTDLQLLQLAVEWAN